MPKSIVRKDKIVLVSNADEKDSITCTINIDSNHVNNNIDTLLASITFLISNFPNYKEQVKEVKESKPKGGKTKLKGAFGNTGQYV
jgi:hypothetical protein